MGSLQPFQEPAPGGHNFVSCTCVAPLGKSPHSLEPLSGIETRTTNSSDFQVFRGAPF